MGAEYHLRFSRPNPGGGPVRKAAFVRSPGAADVRAAPAEDLLGFKGDVFDEGAPQEMTQGADADVFQGGGMERESVKFNLSIRVGIGALGNTAGCAYVQGEFPGGAALSAVLYGWYGKGAAHTPYNFCGTVKNEGYGTCGLVS
ncbi:hypothetical protein FACS189493_4520 [Spirochaetia bacterium]|nr:hypothetical protein FACS189493_4520 [Spirochaetia bacterium]